MIILLPPALEATSAFIFNELLLFTVVAAADDDTGEGVMLKTARSTLSDLPLPFIFFGSAVMILVVLLVLERAVN